MLKKALAWEESSRVIHNLSSTLSVGFTKSWSKALNICRDTVKSAYKNPAYKELPVIRNWY